MPRRWLLTIAAFVGVTLLVLRPNFHSGESDEIKPQTFTLTAGSARRVADGRAQLWLGRVNSEYSAPDGGVTVAAEVELDCLGERLRAWAVRERTSESLCGCRVRLVEAVDTNPPSARLEVTWDTGFTPGLQAASQATRSAPLGGGRRASRTTSQRR